jgi:ribosomal protein S18 acetylase RimI-like enzyme
MTVVLRDMTEAEYDEWHESARAGYAQSFVDSGIMTEEKAFARADKEFSELLPDGIASDNQYLWTAWDGATPVGMLWVTILQEVGAPRAYIYDIEVRPEQRRRGHGRAILDRLAEWSRERGIDSIGLNVFGHNKGAVALYEEAGFEVVAMQMKLPL